MSMNAEHSTANLFVRERNVNDMVNQSHLNNKQANPKDATKFSTSGRILLTLLIVVIVMGCCFGLFLYSRRPATSLYQLADMCNIAIIDEDDDDDDGVIFVPDAISIWRGDGYDFDQTNKHTMECVINHLGADNSYVQYMKGQINQENGMFSFDNPYFHVTYNDIDYTEPLQYCLHVTAS